MMVSRLMEYILCFNLYFINALWIYLMDEPKLDSYLEEPKDEFCQVQEERNSIFHSSLSGALTYSTKWFPSSGEVLRRLPSYL